MLGQKNPFGDEIQGLTEAQIDWILEMYSRDHPDRLKFERASTASQKITNASVSAGWANVLIGKARTEWENRFKPKLPPQWAKRPRGR